MSRGVPLVALAFLVAPLVSGCLGPGPASTSSGALPPGLEDPPEQSELASAPYYTLGQSTTFLAKGVTYARYVFRVPLEVPHASIHFTTGSGQSTAPAPSVDDMQYHYEFIQIRALGDRIRAVDSDAGVQFRHGSVGHTFTLTYIYGNGADYQYLAPFDGNPADWRLEAGFYEVVIASDEALTVGVNVDIGSGYWSTHYHPQELGTSRAVSLDHFGEVASGGLVGHEDAVRRVDGAIHVHEAETLNLFTFADLIYDVRPIAASSAFALDVQGEAVARFGDAEVRQRLAATTVQAQQAEAFAYVALFNEPGPFSVETEARVVFEEEASLGTVRVTQVMVFGVATTALQTVDGIPDPSAPEAF